MLLAKAVLFLVVSAGALEAIAGAQTPRRSGPDADERVAAEGRPERADPGLEAAPRLISAGFPSWLRDYAQAVTVPRAMTLFAVPTLPAGARVVAPRNPAARVMRIINGRFVPIPMLQWRMRVPLDSRATLAISPSIFVGRRPTFMPEGFPGGRTFGLAVHARINLGQSPMAEQSATAGSRAALVASKIKTLLNSR